MSIESLKQKARKAEQKEDWQKALEHYDKALTELARDDQVDIGLYNRVGDLYVRVGRLEPAVEHYEKAVELYREAYLPNNAIAVCKKIIRNVPNHHAAYLVIGQIRAEQGFLPDARTNFLTYAERMQAAGDLDESFRALIEFCDLAPEDVGVRVTVAEQMAAQGRTDEAVEQLTVVHRHYTQSGDDDRADEIEAQIRELDPDADLTAVVAGGFGETALDDDFEGFGEISLGGDAFGSDDESVAPATVADAMEEAASDLEKAAEQLQASAATAPESTEAEAEIDAGLEGFDIQAGGGEALDSDRDPVDFDDDEDEAVELPIMSFDDAEDASEVKLATAHEEDAEDLGLETAHEEEAEDLGLETDHEEEAEDLGLETDDDEEEVVELPIMSFDDDVDSGDAPSSDDAGDSFEQAVEESRSDATEVEPEEVEPAPQAAEEVSAAAPESDRTEAAPSPAEAEPPPSRDTGDRGYVDLGAMILGGGDEKSTRFTVAYEEPSGDEEADFAKMLSQFKEKVSENLDSSDVRAHYDLGTAYKEMGLLDEAITSFQAALRASADHLPTYEMMGQTFIEMGQPEAAVRTLERALDSADTVEDELVGIYYYLGRAYEALENSDSAVDFYDRVFALDINFADVTERLRELR
ncbi:MAG: tetratricopeptide repeat protein [Gemmatimonadetes bacterium]|nr:tetratricopeptide repeat protein [Gemmatimonadota bacterium]